MKDCARIAPMIGSRPGELSAGEARALAAHLETCHACRALSASFAATEGLVAEALLARANARDFAPFVDQVMSSLDFAAARGGRHAQDGRPGRELRAAHRPSVLATLRERWKFAVAAGVAALVLAAVSRFMYGGGRVIEPERFASIEIELSGGSTVLQTPDGPVVLLAPDDAQGS